MLDAAIYGLRFAAAVNAAPATATSPSEIAKKNHKSVRVFAVPLPARGNVDPAPAAPARGSVGALAGAVDCTGLVGDGDAADGVVLAATVAVAAAEVLVEAGAVVEVAADGGVGVGAAACCTTTVPDIRAAP